MADLKEYEVTSEEFVTQDQEVLKRGDRVKLDPKNGITRCGIYFKQLKPAPQEAATEPEAKPAETEAATEPEAKASAKKAAAKSSGTAKK